MAASTTIKRQINRLLAPFNLRLETLTKDDAEMTRLRTLEDAGYFARPAFPVPPAFNASQAESILKDLRQHWDRFDSFEDPTLNEVKYSFDNEYFTSPDAEILYAIVRKFKPAKIIEVGSGNSTKIFRQAIIDGGNSTQLVSIDPWPRIEIKSLADETYARRVEELIDHELFQSLKANDILFIDSSHEIKPGNDVVMLFLQIVPKLAPGILVHIHDISLPFDYDREVVVLNRWEWTEQYLVQAMVQFGNAFEVLWPGRYLQETRTDFGQYFPNLKARTARSLWLRKPGE